MHVNKRSTLRLYDMDGNNVAAFHAEHVTDAMHALGEGYNGAVKMFEVSSHGNIRQTIWRKAITSREPAR